MIIWLASYPKSGNTYVRAFLSAYYFSKDGQFEFGQISNIRQFPDKDFLNQNTGSVLDASKQWMPSQRKIIADKKIKFLKTHSCLGNYKGNTFTSNETSLGAIYIIRDPRNVFTSLKNHFSYDDEKALQMILDKKGVLMSKGYETFSYIGSWASNYLSWLNYKNFRRLFVRYEDLLENKYETFRDIVVFSNTLMNRTEGVNKSKLQKAIETTNFDVLKNKEVKESFNSSDIGFKSWRSHHSENKNLFFNLGPENKWEKNLDKKIKEDIEINFNEEMKNLKYL